MKKLLLLFFLCFQISLLPQEKGLNIELINYKSLDSLVSFRGIFAVDKNTAWASGSRGTVYVTDNGGKSWLKITILQGDSLDFRDIEVISPGTIMLMSAGAGENSRIYKSTNNGKSWKIVYKNTYPEGFLDSIEFWDEKNGICPCALYE